MLTRRQFIQSLTAGAGYCLLPFGGHAFSLLGFGGMPRHRLIVVLLRGAVDGLSVVIPYNDKAYYASRSTIALSPPGSEGGAAYLDGYFGLHPALAPLLPLWKDKHLAFVHASGFPSNVRSHFEAQDIIETASLHSAAHGWLNSLAIVLPDMDSSTSALSFSRELPKIFAGRYNVAIVPPGLKAGNGNTFKHPEAQQNFSALYGGNPKLAALFNEGVSSRDQLADDLHKEMEASGGRAPYPDGFPGQAAKLAAMIRQSPHIELAFMELGGWDTHVAQGNAKGQLAGKLQKLGEGLALLAGGLGQHLKDTTIMVMSEFGRTVAENGNNGTDHGHGNVMWLIGGNVKGGRVHGRWPGLEKAQLFEGRDLEVTTDFRSVVGAALKGGFGLDEAGIARVIPGYKADNGLDLFT